MIYEIWVRQIDGTFKKIKEFDCQKKAVESFKSQAKKSFPKDVYDSSGVILYNTKYGWIEQHLGRRSIKEQFIYDVINIDLDTYSKRLFRIKNQLFIQNIAHIKQNL